LDNPVHVSFIDAHSQMLTDHGRTGADHNFTTCIADHRIKAGNLGGNIQIQQKFPAAGTAVYRVGRCQVCNDLGILLQI